MKKHISSDWFHKDTDHLPSKKYHAAKTEISSLVRQES